MRADREDSKRGLEFVWLNGEVGFQYLGLQTFAANDLVDASVVETNQSGLMVGAGLGVRLVFLTLGPRFRYGSFQDLQVWTLDGELGIRIPLGKLEPYFTFAAGYASLGSLDFGNAVDGGDAKIRGFNGRLGFGLDFYLSNAVSVGATASAEALFLRRPGVKLSNPSTAEDVYAADGSSIGLGLSGAAVIGLHF
jgi:hypothetical protein